VRHPARVPGFDLTFSAPKGVSLLFALGGPRVSGVVLRAHAEAVRQAVGYLEREAGEVRRELAELAVGTSVARFDEEPTVLSVSSVGGPSRVRPCLAGDRRRGLPVTRTFE
jgi:hypothetical protein